MYNRYIPQPDGTYHRKRVEEPRQEPPRPAPPPSEDPPCIQPQPEQAPPCPPPPPPQQPSCNQQSAGSFLRQLLPRDFDTGDLMVIILLLLIAGDCEKELSNALLTLALYFIM